MNIFASSTLSRVFVSRGTLALASTTMHGGPLIAEDATITIDRGLFDQVKYYDGNIDAALSLTNSHTTITNSIIRNNERGIFIDGGQTTITNSLFTDHSVDALFASTSVPVLAANNYWGSPTGPTHPSNPGGTGDRVSDNVSFTPWLGSEPEMTEPTICTVACNSNVLFLSGLQASRLYRSNDAHQCDYYNDFDELVSPTECRIWEPQGDVLSALLLMHNGASVLPDLYTRDIIDDAYGTAAIYSPFMTFMDTLVSADVLNEWEAIPYDWRLAFGDILASGKKSGDNISYLEATTSPYIIQELKRLAAGSRTGKVTIIAHSNGGLLAKELLAMLGTTTSAELIDQLIFVAVPQTGTPQAIGALLHGFKQDIPHAWYLPDGAFFSAAAARLIANDMPSAYNLLPSVQYFRDVQTPVATFANSSPVLTDAYERYGGFLNTWEEMRDFMAGAEGRLAPLAQDLKTPALAEESLVDDSWDTHASLDNWTPPPSISLIEIAGWGVDTVGRIDYTQKKKGDNYIWSYEPWLTEDGDGTVVVPSALAVGTSSSNVRRYWVDLFRHNRGLTTNREHASIFSVDSLLSFIKDNLVRKSVDNLEQYAYFSTSTPPSNPEKKLRFYLHSPLSLELYDDVGRHTGLSTTTGFIENNIPGAYYREFGEVKYITVPASTTLHLVLSGQAQGSFDLKIEEAEGDSVTATTTFVDIPTATSTVVTMDFTDGTIVNASPLSIDEDGDGDVDVTLLPKPGEEVFFDNTPPEAIIVLDPTTLAMNIRGEDTQSPPVAVSASDTAYTLTDGAGNITQLNFDQLLNGAGKQAKVSLASVAYNGALFTLGTTTLSCEWSLDKDGAVKMLNQDAVVDGVHIRARYSMKDNRTEIMKEYADTITREIRQGLVVLTLRTNAGIMEIRY
jgi:pimeloyl-ACP methyl ester carboxylesterase